ncbi:MAG: hypothetical protein K6C94_08700 [Candidatus Gastranaerophilales bacterium]|nr:hypothetical protein [Candidatus Gastranaerophilales bacterium]
MFRYERSESEHSAGIVFSVLVFVSQKAPVHCLDLFAINGVTVLLLASPSASAHRSLHCVAVHFAFCYFGLRPTQNPLLSMTGCDFESENPKINPRVYKKSQHLIISSDKILFTICNNIFVQTGDKK